VAAVLLAGLLTPPSPTTDGIHLPRVTASLGFRGTFSWCIVPVVQHRQSAGMTLTTA
jgi:hypothetical protein